MQVAGDRGHTRLQRLRRFIARSGAHIQKCLAWLEIEKRDNGLRPDVLYANSPDIAFEDSERSGDFGRFQSQVRPLRWISDKRFGRLQGGLRDPFAPAVSELAVPTCDQPLRHRQSHRDDSAIRPRLAAALRNTAFTSPAALALRAIFTNSTLSFRTACAGTRSRRRN